MTNSPNSRIPLAFAVLTAGAIATACSTQAAAPPAPINNAGVTSPGSAQPTPDDKNRPAVSTPVQLTTNGDGAQNQPQELSTPDYKTWAVQLYTQDLTVIHQEQQTLANETAPAPTRAGQITNQLLPQLKQLLNQIQAVQPEDADVASLHQHLINAIQLMTAAYSDIATGFNQNDAAELARGRSELTAEGQELGIWVNGVPQL